MRKKLDSMQRAQSEGDVENGIVMTGQVASGISSLIKIAEFVPAMAEDALRILRKLSSS
jgi:NAD(P)H-dependent flavin oxidoreductase YrpB (nitropropane dioxygenase family)